MSDPAVLLDTCALIWLANGDALAPAARRAINRAGAAAGAAGGVLVSPVSAWEIGLLARRNRARANAEAFLPEPQGWFARAAAGPGVRVTALTPFIAIASAFLPGDLHQDPGDRLLAATARALGVPLVTRDRALLAYAEAGHIEAIAC